MKSRRIVIRHPRKKEPVLWVVDSEQWPRACLRAELIERGYDAYGFITILDALNSLSRSASPKPELIILELRDQSLSIDLLERLCSLGIPTIVLGGITELSDPLIDQRKWDVVLRRPVSLGKVADVAQGFLSRDRPSQA